MTRGVIDWIIDFLLLSFLQTNVLIWERRKVGVDLTRINKRAGRGTALGLWVIMLKNIFQLY